MSLISMSEGTISMSEGTMNFTELIKMLRIEDLLELEGLLEIGSSPGTNETFFLKSEAGGEAVGRKPTR